MTEANKERKKEKRRNRYIGIMGEVVSTKVGKLDKGAAGRDNEREQNRERVDQESSRFVCLDTAK